MPNLRTRMMKVHILKKIDNYLGRILCIHFLHKPLRAISPGSVVNSILIIRPGGIGDAVLLIPAIMALKKKYPRVSITVLAEKRNASVFSMCGQINRVLEYEKPMELLAAIKGEYDAVIDTEQWHRMSVIVATMTRTQTTIGFDTNERKRLLTYPIPYSHDDYEMESFFRLFKPLGIAKEEIVAPFINIPESVMAKAESLLGGFVARPFVAIFPGSTISEKQWDLNKFEKLALQLEQSGIPIIVIGGRKERAAGDAIIHGVDSLNLAGVTSLVETAAIINSASVLVSGDSGVLHLATALGCSTVSLFGSSNAQKWAPMGERHIVISKKLPCSPCSKFGDTPQCRFNTRCMAEIDIEEVAVAIRKLLLG